jgi:hypothetical protein
LVSTASNSNNWIDRVSHWPSHALPIVAPPAGGSRSAVTHARERADRRGKRLAPPLRLMAKWCARGFAIGLLLTLIVALLAATQESPRHAWPNPGPAAPR